MNSLTGKFGQKTHLTSSAIFGTNHAPNALREKHFNELLSRIVDFTPLFARDGQNSAIIVEYQSKDQHPPYPIYLSGQILAYSRVIMSRIMRTADCYRNPERAIFYTDTDSLLMPNSCVPDLIAAGMIGNGLGQLKCDLHSKASHPEEFAKIVKGIWAATKGPYSVLYVLPNAQEKPLMEKVRVKGIPHVGEPFKHYDPIQMHMAEPRERFFAKIRRWVEAPTQWEMPAGVIGERFYHVLVHATGEHYFAKHMNYYIIEQIMQGECTLHCYYGGMKKCFQNRNGEFLLVRPDVVRRTACKTDWWSEASQKRIYLEDRQTPQHLSFPVGYEAPPK